MTNENEEFLNNIVEQTKPCNTCGQMNSPLSSSNGEFYYVEKWYQRAWRPLMAMLYMILNIFDYIIRPLINYSYVKNIDIVDILLKLKDYDTVVQIKLIENLGNAVIPPIMPEFLHLAFGAILGVAAFSRGMEKGFIQGSSMRK